MAVTFPTRALEDSTGTLADETDSLVQTFHDQLAVYLAELNAITGADETRMGLTQAQKDALADLKSKGQAILDEVETQGWT